MTSVLLFALCFIGQRPDALPSAVFQPRTGEQRIVDLPSLPNPAEARRSPAALEQKGFEESFNRLGQALADFADQYNQHHTIDVKKVRAMKKAWRELEKSEPWFKGN